ncbi:MAG TPA: CBS domain-containing protein [Patescibacteria group bacterium]|nr:CBS domain-containing protein [Patescibacteria group bacterium]
MLKDIMTTDVITISPETSLKEVGAILKRDRVSGLPVVDKDGAVVGVITLTDMLRILDQIYHWKEIERRVPEIKLSDMFEKEKAEAKVKSIMTKEVLVLDESSPIDEVMRLMFDRKVHTIPVTRNGKLVGVVGKRDLISACFK